MIFLMIPGIYSNTAFQRLLVTSWTTIVRNVTEPRYIHVFIALVRSTEKSWLEIGFGQWHFQFWVVKSPIVLLPGKISVKPAQGGELQDAERKFAESYKVLIIEHLNKMNNERTWWTTSKSIWLFFSVVPVSDAQRATEWLRVYHAVGCPLLLLKCKTQTE